jgi:hypothetical protein
MIGAHHHSTLPTKVPQPTTLQVVKLIDALVVPLVFKAVPELTRGSGHRGEVADMQHSELYVDAVRLHSN